MTRIEEVRTPDGRVLRAHVGDEDGFPLVVHHGTPGGGELLSSALDDARGRGLRMIGIDRPGYGGSDRQPGRTVASAATDVATVLDHLGLDRFVTWGSSGGGPHALACAVLLADRCAAVASVAGVAPYDAAGLEWLAGMGEDNVEEFGVAAQGEAALRPWLEEQRGAMLQTDAAGLVEQMRTLLPPVDVAALGGPLGTYLHDNIHGALRHGVDGWLDDDLAFLAPWGFDPADVTVPALVVAGGQDLMVPVAHGRWLAEHVPSQPRLDDAAGHLSILHDIGSVHAWLREHAS